MPSGATAFTVVVVGALVVLVVGLVAAAVTTPSRHEASIDRWRRPRRE